MDIIVIIGIIALGYYTRDLSILGNFQGMPGTEAIEVISKLALGFILFNVYKACCNHPSG
jgi:hypothetical protein